MPYKNKIPERNSQVVDKLEQQQDLSGTANTTLAALAVLVAATNTKIDTLNTKIDALNVDVETTNTKLDSTNTKLDTLEISVKNDSTTGAVTTIDYAHHEIHDGDHFLYTDHVELDSAATQDYLITTPDTTKWAHMIFVMDGSAVTMWGLYESTDKSGTTLQTIGNSNRNSLTAATLTVHKGVSGGTTDGTLIHEYKGGSATNQSRSGTDTRNDEEIILKRNTKYILRVTSGTNDNLTNVRLSWYEHTNA